MQVKFVDSELSRLETDSSYTMGLSQAVVSAFRKRILHIRQAEDERAIRNMKSLHFEKLLGSRSHQHSIRLNEQYRLILEIEEQQTGKVIIIVSIEDYH